MPEVFPRPGHLPEKPPEGRNETPEEFELEEHAMDIMFEGIKDGLYASEHYGANEKRVRVKDKQGKIIYDEPEYMFEISQEDFNWRSGKNKNYEEPSDRGRIDTPATD